MRSLTTGPAARFPGTNVDSSTGGVIQNRGDTIVVRLNRRTYSPVLRSADIQETPVPWWGGRRLRFEYA
jgi:hypothetical protein